jgi:hypothetical protein
LHGEENDLNVYLDFILRIKPADNKRGDPDEDKDTDENKSEGAEAGIHHATRSPKIPGVGHRAGPALPFRG